MGKTRRIRVRVVRKEKPDVQRLSRAIIEMVMAEAEAAAQAEHEQRNSKDGQTPKGSTP